MSASTLRARARDVTCTLSHAQCRKGSLMLVRGLYRVGILVALVLFTFQATRTLAGTTGAINGNVSLTDGTPITSARVAATSPSQSSTALTDSHGHYAMLSLAADTYTVTASKEGYDSVVQLGVTVVADQVQTVNLVTRRTVATLGKVTVLGASTSLVSRSQTSNVYTMNATQIQAVQASGGGNNLENAYSALDNVPGIYHFSSNAGWGQTVFIHGGNYTEVGYEYDGVPVNRAFDQYNGDTLSTLGNEQIEVYTGGAPASSSTSTVSGFINQVIKTGTYPGFANLDLSVGSPSLWNGAKLDIGGATPDRKFTYYAGVSNFTESIRYLDQFNGGQSVTSPFLNPSSYNAALFTFYGEGTLPYCSVGPGGVLTWPIPNPNTNAGCFIKGLPQVINDNVGTGETYGGAGYSDHEAVVNLHFGIPHPHDGSRDDIQTLYSGSFLPQKYYSSINDDGGLANVATLTGGTGFLNLITLLGICATPAPCYADGYAWPNGTSFGQTVTTTGAGNNGSNLPYIRYMFPSSPTNRALNSTIGVDARDGISVSDEIGKFQYTHAMGSNAYLRFFAYSLYSNWLENAPIDTVYTYEIGLAQLAPTLAAPDYELSSHTYGGELQFQDQISDRNLLNFTTNLTTAHTLRFNNSEMLNGPGSSATVLSDASGNCYAAVAGTDPNTGAPITAGERTWCSNPLATGTFTSPTQGGVPIVGAAGAAGAAWHVSFLGPTGTYNTVAPTFTTGGLQDEFKVSDKLLLNGGIRFENYKYDLANSDTADNNFWFHAAAQEYCYDPATGQPVRLPLGPLQAPPAAPYIDLTCPNSPITGKPTVHPDGLDGHLLFTNAISGPIDHSEWLPRFGGTYSLSDDTVIRFNYGRYAQPVETAFTEYLYAPGAGKNAAAFNFVNFWGLGFTTPRHDLPPVTANNYDLSLEQRIPHSTWAFRLSPFFRSSHDEYGTVTLGPNFASGFPYGNEQAQGVEFSISGGNPGADGLSGQFSFTYTHATVKLLDTPNGTNGIDVLNGFIDGFNALTSAGNVQGLKGAPCYDGGVAAPSECIVSGSNITLSPSATGSTIINPYYFDPRQPDLDRNGSYLPYQTFPSGALNGANSNVWPYLFHGYLAFKHQRFSISPIFSLLSGDNYGDPTDIIGYDPRTCGQNQGAAGVPDGNPGKANFVTCGASLVNGGLLAIPNPTTGTFDSVGQYRQPWLLNLAAQVSAEISPTVTGRIIFANILNTCFGGSSTPWSKAFPPGNQTCFYSANGLAVSNFWNGTGPNDPVGNVAPAIPQYNYPYLNQPYAGGFNPFQMTFQLQFKM